jgi:predicted RNase H-like nuclease (RuvC/YqgF family)
MSKIDNTNQGLKLATPEAAAESAHIQNAELFIANLKEEIENQKKKGQGHIIEYGNMYIFPGDLIEMISHLKNVNKHQSGSEITKQLGEMVIRLDQQIETFKKEASEKDDVIAKLRATNTELGEEIKKIVDIKCKLEDELGKSKKFASRFLETQEKIKHAAQEIDSFDVQLQNAIKKTRNLTSTLNSIAYD